LRQSLEFRDARPVAVIIEEPPAFARLEVFGRKRTGLCHVPFNPGAQGFDVIGKQPLDQNNAIALKRVDLFLCDAAWHKRSPLGSATGYHRHNLASNNTW
jgi:hypothetical protein